MSMISKIYNSDYILHKAGSRFGKSKTEIKSIEAKIQNNSSDNISTGFINFKTTCFRVGKYKGTPVRRAPKQYILWVITTLKLSEKELKYLKSVIKKE
jgi:hypothetical protein